MIICSHQKQNNDRSVTLLRQNFERQSIDLKEKYHLRMEKFRREMEELGNILIKILQDQKDLRIQQLTKEHSKKYTEMRHYYSDITTKNLDMKKKERRKDKKLLSIENESKNLNKPLKERCLQKMHLITLFNQFRKELDCKIQLLKKQLLLMMNLKLKLFNLTKSQRELISIQTQQTSILNSIKIQMFKQVVITELQNQFTLIRKAHFYMVKAYDGKLAECVIPV